MRPLPTRMCVTCRRRRHKPELVRLIHGLKGVGIDSTGRAQTRGAYVCADNSACWEEKKLRRFAGSGAGRLAAELNGRSGGDRV